jgi:hypothetical protein
VTYRSHQSWRGWGWGDCEDGSRRGRVAARDVNGGVSVSPPSGGGVGPSECSEGELSKHAPVFFEDALFGWCVGLVLGYAQRGWVAVKDAQRDREVEVPPRRGVVPVPQSSHHNYTLGGWATDCSRAE